MASKIDIHFWGTRGVVSAPGKDKAKYGGNTSCIQVLHEDQLIIVDTGFGSCLLGEGLMERILKNKEKITAHIFFTNFHWDHTQGLPFFHPVYFPSSTINLYSPATEKQMVDNLDILFDGSYSPFAGIHNMPANINFVTLTNEISLGKLKVSFHKTRDFHANQENEGTIPSFAYRFEESGGTSVSIITNHEAIGPENDDIIEFAKGSSLVVHDAQFTDEEYKSHIGWGHSNVTQALSNAEKMQAKRALLTHHAPQRLDSELDRLSAKIGSTSKISFEFAREGVTYPVEHSLKKQA